MNEVEIWKNIAGYEGRYQVSNLGQIRSVSRWVNAPQERRLFVEGRILSLQRSKVGYVYVSLLGENQKQKRWLVHRLVALTFIPNPCNYPTVNHIDENKSNNRVSNLEWCSYSYNISYGKGNENRKESKKKKIEMYNRETGEYIKTFNSIDEASEITGVNRTTISEVAANRYGRRSAGGYIWRFGSESERKKRGLRDEIVVLERYPRKRKVEMLNKETEEVIRTFNSISEAANSLNISERQIQGVCSHKKYQHSAGGYGWRYAD